MMKLPESTKKKIVKMKILKLCLLEIAEVFLIHCNITVNDYHYDSRVLYTFFPNKSFGQLLDISAKMFIVLKTFN